MNPVVEGPVQLHGRGYVWRPTDVYDPGEYFELINCYLTNRGTLKSRPPVQGYTVERPSSVRSYFSFDNRPLGNHGPYFIFSCGPYLMMAKDFSIEELDYSGTGVATYLTNVMAKRPVATGGLDTTRNKVKYLGYFVYNDREYLISNGMYNVTDGSGDSYGYVVVSSAPSINPLKPNTLGNHVVGDTVFYDKWAGFTTNRSAFYTNNVMYAEYPLVDYTMHKDRLWIARKDIVYFSKATDPTVFAVPDGGFFKFPGRNIKAIKAIGDIIYVIGDSSIHAISYSTDPNVDSEVSVVSETIGGEGAAIIGDTLYSVKLNSIWAVNGRNVSKVADLDISLSDTRTVRTTWEAGISQAKGSSFGLAVEAFQESIYIVPQYIQYVPDSSFVYPGDVRYDTQGVSPRQYTSGLAFGAYRYDVGLDFLSKYDFGANGVPYAMKYIPVEDTQNQTRLFFTTNGTGIRDTRDNYAPHLTYSLGSRPYYPSVSNPLDPNFPSFVDLDPTFIGMDTSPIKPTLPPTATLDYLRAEHPRARIIIKNFSPDNLSYLIKKFRSLEFKLKVPYRYNDNVSSRTWVPALKVMVFAGDDGSTGSLPSDPDPFASLNTLIESYLTSPLHKINNHPEWLSTQINQVWSETVRYGVNQRTPRITVDLSVLGFFYDTIIPASLMSDPTKVKSNVMQFLAAPVMEIEDIRTLWTYTAKGPANRRSGS